MFVSMWMRRHLAVVTVPVDERSTLAEIEEADACEARSAAQPHGHGANSSPRTVANVASGIQRQPGLSPVAGRWDGHRGHGVSLR